MQVLFAFLLVVPFSNGFSKVTEGERVVYIAAVVCTTLATTLLIAPTTYHRLLFRQHDKEQLIDTSSRFVVAGTVLLGCAMCCAVYLVGDFVFNSWVGALLAGFAAAGFAVFWYALPLSRRAMKRRQ